MSLTNPNKVVTEERLSEFYQTILPYLGGMPEAIANKFSRGDLYSTDEKIVGCWTDGRPLYQKTYNFGTLPNNNTKTLDTGFADGEINVIDCTGYAFNPTTNHTWKLPAAPNPTDLKTSIVLNVPSSNRRRVINVQSGTNRSAWTECYITLKYTKTTDSANSFNFSTETDYSTTEHIIGTWIDGKPLYQRTYLVTIPTRGNRTAIVIDATFDRIVNSEISANKVSGNNRWRFGSSASYSFGANDIVVYVEGNIVYIGNESSTDSYGGGDAYVTLQYTKTTD